MDDYRDEIFKSTTRWKNAGLPCPKNSNNFQDMINQKQIPNCVLKTGANTFFFQWKQVGRIIDTDIIVHNNINLELALWEMVDIIYIINDKLPTTSLEKNTSQLHYYRTILQLLANINEFVKSYFNLDTLLPNLSLPWNMLLEHGEYKLPWMLIPSCNKALDFWICSKYIRWKAEKDRKQTSISNVHDKTVLYLKYQCAAYLLLETGLEHANNSCHATLITAYKNEKHLALVKAYIWLASTYPEGAENFFLLKEALHLTENSCGSVNKLFVEKIREKFDTANNYCTLVEPCGYRPVISPSTLLSSFLSNNQDVAKLTTVQNLNLLKQEIDEFLNEQNK